MIERTLTNSVNSRDIIVGWQSDAGACDALWIEILGNHPRHPVFVLGVGPAPCDSPAKEIPTGRSRPVLWLIALIAVGIGATWLALKKS